MTDTRGSCSRNSSTRIFASATSLESICFRQINEGIAFATTRGPLMELDNLTTDWDAWIDTLALGYPIRQSRCRR